MTDSPDDKRDFFISYNQADQTWAKWIAWQLEQAGHSLFIQAWDFQPGHHFVLEMDRAAQTAERTIIVLSPNFLASSFAPSEWAAAFARDPTAEKRFLVPVRVQGSRMSVADDELKHVVVVPGGPLAPAA